MILPKELPRNIQELVSWEYVPESRIHEAGWDVPNSVIARDCVPTFRLKGPHTDSRGLTDLETALERCIERQDARIAECERFKSRLKNALVEVKG